MPWRTQVRSAVIALLSALSLCLCVPLHADTLSCLESTEPADGRISLNVMAPARIDAARLISVLVEIDKCSRDHPFPEDAKSMLMLRAGDVRLSVHLSRFAMEVSLGRVAANAARDIDIQLLRRYIPLGVKYLLFNIYISPGADPSSTPYGRVVVKANEATLRGADVLVGREIADPMRSFSLAGLDALAEASISITSEQEGGRFLLSAKQRLIPFDEVPRD